MDNLLYWLELVGVVVLAISGGFQASIKQLDIGGFLFVAGAAGIAGGTLRDLLLYHGPVFWVREPLWLWLTSAVAVLVYFIAPHMERRYAALLWADALVLLFSVRWERMQRSRREPRPVLPSSWAP
jgi:uncharacterized membrane protein YeiH